MTEYYNVIWREAGYNPQMHYMPKKMLIEWGYVLAINSDRGTFEGYALTLGFDGFFETTEYDGSGDFEETAYSRDLTDDERFKTALGILNDWSDSGFYYAYPDNSVMDESRRDFIVTAKQYFSEPEIGRFLAERN